MSESECRVDARFADGGETVDLRRFRTRKVDEQRINALVGEDAPYRSISEALREGLAREARAHGVDPKEVDD
jgi:hypothetical protein